MPGPAWPICRGVVMGDALAWAAERLYTTSLWLWCGPLFVVVGVTLVAAPSAAMDCVVSQCGQ